MVQSRDAYLAFHDKSKEEKRKDFDGRHEFEGFESVEIRDLPDHLYRQITFSDLYQVWRDKELPLGYHEGNRWSKFGTSAPHNLITTFWFGEPMAFNKYDVEAIAKFDTKQIDELEYTGEGQMNFKLKIHQVDPFGHGAHSPAGSVPEYYIGDRLKEEQLEFAVSNRSKSRAEELEKVAEELLEGKTDDESSLDQGREKIDGFLKSLIKREFGRDQENWPDECKNVDSLITDTSLREVIEFCKWVQGLPVQDMRELSDLDDKDTDSDFLLRNHY